MQVHDSLQLALAALGCVPETESEPEPPRGEREPESELEPELEPASQLAATPAGPAIGPADRGGQLPPLPGSPGDRSEP